MSKVVHFEIPVDNLERAKKFYAIFDWNIQDWPMPDGSVYVGCQSVETDPITHAPKEAGAINGGMILRNNVSKTPSITLHVPSIDAYAEKISNAGGKMIKAKTVIQGGAFAYFTDSEGNVFGLWEDAPKLG